jgi:hypothetical protein
VVVYFKIFTVASIAFANKTLLSLLRSLPCQAAVATACCCYYCSEKKRKSTVLHVFIYFTLSIMIVSLTAKATAMMTVIATAMIYHLLFYDSNKTIVVIIYFSFFS